MDILFKLFILGTISQRLYELRLARRNERYLIAQGANLIPEKNYIFMIILHAAWLASILFMAFTQTNTYSKPLFFTALIFFIIGQTLRLTAIKTLGKRWTTKIVILPHRPAIRRGIFKIFRHPNYLGVIVEIAALPLMAGLYQLAIFFSIANLIILFFRIRLEERMLILFNDYSKVFDLKQNEA